MHMALIADEWLSLNAWYCNRYHARLTPDVCKENRESTENNCRCHGCNGLEEQERQIERLEPIKIYSEDNEELDPTPMTQALAGVLQEVLEWNGEDSFLEDEQDETDEEDGELTSFQRQLVALLGDGLEDQIIERKQVKKGPWRSAVFMGRCPRCRGYMVNAPERYNEIRDEDVHRCFNCGFRTSPGYEWNRQQ